jgi:hypothetical protein
MSRVTDQREAGRMGIHGTSLSRGGSDPRVTSEAIGRDINPLGRGNGMALVGGMLNLGRIAPMLAGAKPRGGAQGSSVNNKVDDPLPPDLRDELERRKIVDDYVFRTKTIRSFYDKNCVEQAFVNNPSDWEVTLGNSSTTNSKCQRMLPEYTKILRKGYSDCNEMYLEYLNQLCARMATDLAEAEKWDANCHEDYLWVKVYEVILENCERSDTNCDEIRDILELFRMGLESCLEGLALMVDLADDLMPDITDYVNRLIDCYRAVWDAVQRRAAKDGCDIVRSRVQTVEAAKMIATHNRGQEGSIRSLHCLTCGQ